MSINPRQLQALIRYEKNYRAANGDYRAFVEVMHPDVLNPLGSTYDFQPVHERMIDEIQRVVDGRTRNLILTSPPRSGKAIAHYVPVPTPIGWVYHGELTEGSEVFGPNGDHRTVIATTEEVDGDCEVLMSTGEVIRCSEDHLWTVFTDRNFEWHTVDTKRLMASDMRRGATPNVWLPSVLVPDELHVDNTLPDVHANALKGPKTRREVRRIIGARRANETFKCKCIQVDNEDGLYVVGRTLIPTHNSEICARMLFPFVLGRKPEAENIYGSYGAGLSGDIARDVINLMGSSSYRQVFPDVTLKKKADDGLRTNSRRGRAYFAGRGTSLTGKGVGNGGVLVLDDLYKDAKEADSEVIREAAWNWTVKVAMSRRINDRVPMIFVFTRWSHDDVIGRLINPDSLYYNEKLAKSFRYVNFPAECLDEENDPLGRKLGESVWPTRFSRQYLAEMKQADARAYSALYLGDPSPVDGVYFKSEDMSFYLDRQRPDLSQLSIYGATDFAITEAAKADYTVHLIVGVDSDQNIWVLDMWRKRAGAEAIIDSMIYLIDKWEPVMWFGERGQISKSLAPFMRKRMIETNTFCAVRTIVPVADKPQRARSIQGRFNQGLVHLPANRTWSEDIRKELLGFQAGAAHDDIPDAFGLIGLGLDGVHGSSNSDAKPANPEQDQSLGDKVTHINLSRIGRKPRTLQDIKDATEAEGEAQVIQLNRRRF